MDWKRNQGNISFHNSLKIIEYFRATLIKQLKDCMIKILRPTKRNLKKISEEPKDLPWSCIGRMNIVKMSSYKKQEDPEVCYEIVSLILLEVMLIMCHQHQSSNIS